MKITVRVVGVLDAEMELPEPGGVSPLGVASWRAWHAEQFGHSFDFIDRCAIQASNIIRESRVALEDPES
jgi:hypothetical protein